MKEADTKTNPCPEECDRCLYSEWHALALFRHEKRGEGADKDTKRYHKKFWGERAEESL